MRSSDVIAVALVAIAGLVVVQATWEPPDIALDEAAGRVGETVRVQGILVQAHWYDGGGRGTLVGDGAALALRFHDAHGFAAGTALTLQGTLAREGGAPILEVATATASSVDGQRASLASLARDPADAIDRTWSLAGTVDGRHFSADGHTIRLLGDVPPDGRHVIAGAFVHHAPCVCHAIVVAQWN